MVRTALATLAALLLFPALAHAAGTIAVSGDTLVFTGTADPDALVLFHLAQTDELGVQPRSGGGTGPSAWGRLPRRGRTRHQRPAPVRVPRRRRDEGRRLDRRRNDLLTVTLDPDRFARTVDMGDGDDRLDDSTGGGRVELGAGDDELVTGGGIAMTVLAGAGDDELFCDGDFLRATRARGARTVDAGAGRDRVCGGRGDDHLDGGGGDDKLYAGEGEDVLDGEAGDDLLEGGDETDRIAGGRGEDEIDAGAGKDEIRARDREVDDVACGSKRDTVTADRRDDLSRCEIVHVRYGRADRGAGVVVAPQPAIVRPPLTLSVCPVT